MISRFFANVSMKRKMVLVPLISMMFIWIGLVSIAMHAIYRSD